MADKKEKAWASLTGADDLRRALAGQLARAQAAAGVHERARLEFLRTQQEAAEERGEFDRIRERLQDILHREQSQVKQ